MSANDLRTETSDQTILIKDARIAHLETQFQKALEGKLNAELAASASAEQTNAPPPVFTSGDESARGSLLATVLQPDRMIFIPPENSWILLGQSEPL